MNKEQPFLNKRHEIYNALRGIRYTHEVANYWAERLSEWSEGDLICGDYGRELISRGFHPFEAKMEELLHWMKFDIEHGITSHEYGLGRMAMGDKLIRYNNHPIKIIYPEKESVIQLQLI